MKVFCKELNKEFTDKEEMFKALLLNYSKLIELKKASIKESDSVTAMFLNKSIDSEKKLDFVKDGFIYPVINTTNYLDSHGDVHFPNIWNKSLKDKAKKIFYVLEHKLSIDNVVAYPNDVTAFTKEVLWKDLGIDFEGSTQALIYEIPKDKIKIPLIKALFEDKTPFENSVRMRYITMDLAVDTKNPDMSKNKALFDDRINQIANK
jgi:predicted HicB family RNase H-like nuclease